MTNEQIKGQKIRFGLSFSIPAFYNLSISDPSLPVKSKALRICQMDSVNLANTFMYILSISFLPRDAMHKRGLCRRAVSVCLSVCLSRL